MRPARVPGLAILAVLAVAFAACGGREEPAAPEAEPAEELPADVPEPATEPITPEPGAEPATEPAPAEAAPEAAAPPAETAAVAQPATIDFELYKAGFIVGVSGGKGTLHFQGRSYPLSIGGVSVGATAGVSKAELTGEVQNLQRVADIEGTYSAVQAGLTLGGGEKITQLENSKGVVLRVRGKQMGIELSLDLNGMQISLAK
jgi:hypothetical protein